MTEKKSITRSNKERALAVLGEVYDIEVPLRNFLRDLSRKVDFIPEALVEVNSSSAAPHKRAGKDIEKVRGNLEKFIDGLTLTEMKIILEIKPACLIRAETLARLASESKDFTDYQNRVRQVMPPGTLLSVMGDLILAEKVDEAKFLKYLGELGELRNAAAHWKPVSEKNVARATELKDTLLSMIKLRVPSAIVQKLSGFQQQLNVLANALSVAQRTIASAIPDDGLKLDISPYDFGPKIPDELSVLGKDKK